MYYIRKFCRSAVRVDLKHHLRHRLCTEDGSAPVRKY